MAPIIGVGVGSSFSRTGGAPVGATSPGQTAAPALSNPTSTGFDFTRPAPPNDDGGAPVLGYDLRWTTNGTDYTVIQDIAASGTVAGVPAASAVTVQVRAYNVVNREPDNWSPTAQIETLSIVPVITEFTGSANGSAAYTGSFRTTSAAGVAFVGAVPSADPAPSKAELEFGGGDVVGRTSLVPPTSGVNPISGSGLADATSYRLYLFQRNPDGVETAVVAASNTFTTAADAFPPQLTGAALPAINGTVGQAIAPVDVSGAFNLEPAGYSGAAGTLSGLNLPTGLSMSTAGVITGTPTQAWSANYGARGTNDDGSVDRTDGAVAVSAQTGYPSSLENPTIGLNLDGFTDYKVSNYLNVLKNARQPTGTADSYRDTSFDSMLALGTVFNDDLEVIHFPTAAETGHSSDVWNIDWAFDWAGFSPYADLVAYRSGAYVLKWTGGGTTSLLPWGGVTITNTQANRVEFTVNGSGFWAVRMENLDEGNPPTDLFCGRAIDEAAWDAGQVWNPDYLNALKEFRTARMVNLSRTTAASLGTVAQQPKETWITQTTNYGVAIEDQIDICNRTGMDLWECYPFRTLDPTVGGADTPAYGVVKDWAGKIDGDLNPGLTAFHEYSNECWNFGFDTFSDSLRPLSIAAGWEAAYGIYNSAWAMQAKLHVQMAQLVKAEATTNPSRHMFVLGTQLGNLGHTNQVLYPAPWDSAEPGHEPLANHVDIVACACYFGGTFFRNATRYAALKAQIDSDPVQARVWLRDWLLDEANAGIDTSIPWMRDSLDALIQAVADWNTDTGGSAKVGIYEYGSHLLQTPNTTVDGYVQDWMIDFYLSSEMGDLYDAQNAIFRARGASIGMAPAHFSDFTLPSTSGAWGIYRHEAEAAVEANWPVRAQKLRTYTGQSQVYSGLVSKPAYAQVYTPGAGPVASAPGLSITGLDASWSVTVDKAGTIYGLITTNASADQAAIDAAQATGPAPGSYPFSVAAAGAGAYESDPESPVELDTGEEGNTFYVRAYATDGANPASAVVGSPGAQVGETATVSNVSAATATGTISFDTDTVDGEAYAVWAPQGQPLPTTPEQVLAGQDGNGSAVPVASADVETGTGETIASGDLTPGSFYTPVVVQDIRGLYSSVVSGTEFQLDGGAGSGADETLQFENRDILRKPVPAGFPADLADAQEDTIWIAAKAYYDGSNWAGTLACLSTTSRGDKWMLLNRNNCTFRNGGAIYAGTGVGAPSNPGWYACVAEFRDDGISVQTEFWRSDGGGSDLTDPGGVVGSGLADFTHFGVGGFFDGGEVTPTVVAAASDFAFGEGDTTGLRAHLFAGNPLDTYDFGSDATCSILSGSKGYREGDGNPFDETEAAVADWVDTGVAWSVVGPSPNDPTWVSRAPAHNEAGGTAGVTLLEVPAADPTTFEVTLQLFSGGAWGTATVNEMPELWASKGAFDVGFGGCALVNPSFAKSTTVSTDDTLKVTFDIVHPDPHGERGTTPARTIAASEIVDVSANSGWLTDDAGNEAAPISSSYYEPPGDDTNVTNNSAASDPATSLGVSHRKISWEFSAPVAAAVGIDGAPYIDGTSATLVATLPVETSIDNGAELNPDYTHVQNFTGYTTRVGNTGSIGYDAALRVTYPQALVTGDVVSKTRRTVDPQADWGAQPYPGIPQFILQCSAIQLIDGGLSGNQLAPSALGSDRTVYTLTDTLENLVSTYFLNKPTSTITFRQVGDILCSAKSYNVTHMQDDKGQGQTRRRLGEATFCPWDDSYGRNFTAVWDEMVVAMHTDYLTTAQKADCLRCILKNAVLMKGGQYIVNGATNQGFDTPQALLYAFTGRAAEMSSINWGANVKQVFRLTAQDIIDLTQPHTETTKPASTRTTGKDVTLIDTASTPVAGPRLYFANLNPLYSGQNGEKYNWGGMLLKRVGGTNGNDGATARIEYWYPGQQTPLVHPYAIIDAQPSPAFAVGDILIAVPGTALSVDLPIWAISGRAIPRAWTYAKDATYRNLAVAEDAWVAMRTTGVLATALEPYAEYAQQIIASSYPEADNNWPSTWLGAIGNFDGSVAVSPVLDFWNLYSADVLAATQWVNGVQTYPPTLTGTPLPAITGTAGQAITPVDASPSFNAEPGGYSGDPAEFADVSLPTGLTINASTGVISGTPSAAWTNSYSVSCTNDDGSVNAVGGSVNIQAATGPTPLAIDSADVISGHSILDRLDDFLEPGLTQLNGGATNFHNSTGPVGGMGYRWNNDPTAGESIGARARLTNGFSAPGDCDTHMNIEANADPGGGAEWSISALFGWPSSSIGNGVLWMDHAASPGGCEIVALASFWQGDSDELFDADWRSRAEDEAGYFETLRAGINTDKDGATPTCVIVPLAEVYMAIYDDLALGGSSTLLAVAPSITMGDFFNDNIHQSQLGKWVTALCAFMVLRRRPASEWPKDITGPTAPSPPGGWTTGLADALRDIVTQVVTVDEASRTGWS